MSDPNAPDKPAEPHSSVPEEVQLLLSERRTALSTLRTGIAIFPLPLSVMSIFIATPRFYDVPQVMRLLVLLLLLNVGLTALAVYLVVHAIRLIHRYDRLIQKLKCKHGTLAGLKD